MPSALRTTEKERSEVFLQMTAYGDNIKIFSGNSNPVFAETICRALNIPIGLADVKTFADGEVSVSLNETVRGADVFLVQSTCKPVNDRLMELLVMADACRRASAGRITAVIPYFGYARQDRKAKSRDPISAKLVANMITAAGADRVLTMDLHMSLAIVDKRRQKANECEVMNVIGDVRGKTCILYDDMVDTAGSLCNAANALVEVGGAKAVYACATHGVLSGPAYERIEDSPIQEIVFLNTIPQVGNTASNKIKFLDVAPVFARAIEHIHGGTSIADLF